jgi:ketosteroid isomerase-like protein
VFAAERAFAKTMADRNPEAFATYIAEEAIFLSGSSQLRGKEAVVDGWAVYFTAPTAPFSWEPEEVEVFASGRLAASSGPVRNPQGKVIARFNSIWQREDSGRWRVVFDKGSRVCGCESP